MVKRENNGFLITCICSILLLLTLCYFGVNSQMKGTMAATCPAGQYYATLSCTDCGKGYYCDGSTRTKCADGYTTNTTTASSSSACIKSSCSNGYYYATTGCAVCGTGYFCSGNVRTKCADGYTTNTTTASSSSDCVKKSTNTGTTTCPAGQYYATTSCANCGKGYYCDGNGSRKSCGEGYTTNTTTASSETECVKESTGSNMCEPGYFYNTVRCEKCGYGKYCVKDKKNSCPEGYTTTTETASSESECVKVSMCSAGQYYNGTSCVNCGKGYYCNGGASRTACDVGYTTNTETASSESECVRISNGSGDGNNNSGDGNNNSGDGNNNSGDGNNNSGDGNNNSGDGNNNSGDGNNNSGDGNNNSNDDKDVTKNPVTGEITIIALVWFCGLLAIGYAFYYFKEGRGN